MGNIRKTFTEFLTLLFFASLIVMPLNTVKAQTSSGTLLSVTQWQKDYSGATLSLVSSPSISVVPLINATSSTAPTLLWNFSIDGGFSAPVVENGAVYVSSGSSIYALNVSDGNEFWNNSAGWGLGGVAVADGKVFTTGYTNGVIYTDGERCSDYVIAINAKTGNTTWIGNGEFGFNPYYNTPVVANGVVYGSSNVVGMFTLNAQTGKTIWSFTGGEDISAGVDISNALGMWSSPVVANGRVYIAAQAGIYVLKASNGVELWNSTIAPFFVSPIVTNGVIYAGSSDGNVYALNANNGDKLWNYTTGASMPPVPRTGDVLAYSDSQEGNLASILYAYSQNGSLYALSPTTGEKLWNQTVPINSYPYNPPTPVVADNVIYVGSGGGNLYAFDAVNGDKLWNYTIESANNTMLSTPSIVNGVLYTSANNNVYALRVSSTPQPSPTVAEWSWLVIVSLLLSVFAVAVVVRHRKRALLAS
jgi:outer membrane protein assembly factor BamB